MPGVWGGAKGDRPAAIQQRKQGRHEEVLDANTVTLIALAIGILVVLSALFSGMETAILSLSELKLRARVDAGEDVPRVLRTWLTDPFRVLTTLLIGNNAVNITASALATYLAETLLSAAGHTGWGIPVAIGGMTLLILIFGEVVPKSFAKYHPEGYVKLFVVLAPFYLACELFAPLMLVITRFAVERAGGDLRQLNKVTVTEEDIEEMVRVGRADGSIDAQGARLLTGVLELDAKVAREIMVPRLDVHALPVDAPLSEVLAEVRRTRLSRYPIYRETIDDVVGVLYVKDLLNALSGDDSLAEQAPLADLMRAPMVFPENIPVEDLLRAMKAQRVHLAIVASEYGGVAGLVTLEDIVEEVFGDIYDEHDVKAEPLQRVEEGRWLVEGSVTISDLEDELEVEIGDADDDTYETVAGLLMKVAGCMPEVGFRHDLLEVSFEVTQVDGTRLLEVEVTHEPPSDVDPAAAPGVEGEDAETVH